MDIKELASEIIDVFFIVFTCSILSWFAYFWLLGIDLAPIHDIVAILVASTLSSMAGIVLYSSRGLKRHELLVRHAAHLLVIMVIGLSIASYMGWLLWSEPMTVIWFVVLIVVVYITVLAITFYKSKKLMDQMNEKLKERYQE